MVTKVAFVLDGYSTDQWDLIYVEDPLFQDPKLTSKDNKSIVELKVRRPPAFNSVPPKQNVQIAIKVPQLELAVKKGTLEL